jgi:putative nucleotidyltransferase with HDIG domain
MPRTFLLFLAMVLSLIGQMLLFTPEQFESILASARWTAILPLAGASLLYYFYFRHSGGDWKIQALLPVIQICILIGLFLLFEPSGRATRGGVLLLTTLITLLTTVPLMILPVQAGSPVVKPFVEERDIAFGSLTAHPSGREQALSEQVRSLTAQIQEEKYRVSQLTLLNELSQQLEAELDPPVSAQLAVNTLERAVDCSVVALFMYELDSHEYIVLASAGKMTSLIPPGYRQDANIGLLGRTTRSRKTNMVHDVGLDSDVVRLENDTTRSIISIPILQHGYVKAVLEICSEKQYAFGSADAAVAEGVASELMRAWERASYHQRLTVLIQAGISLTTLMDPPAAVQEIAAIARNALEAQFVFVTLLDQQGNFSRTASAGTAVKLAASLDSNPANEPLMQAALNAPKPFRVRDLRKYSTGKKLEIDHAGLRSVLAIPIRLHRLSIGTILAFGKQEGIFFSENDESLADLLSSQAAASIESSWLYQELRNTLNITSMLYQLSVDVIQAEELSKAASLIAQTAHKVMSANETGIVLLTPDGRIQAEVEIDANGLHFRREYPMQTIDQAIISGQSIIVSVENGSLVCYPLLTRSRTYGALWMNIPESRGQNYANLQTLANQAGIALERSILLLESRQQAKQLEAAYAELETIYDRTLSALMSALDARDRETEGHSTRVSRLTCMLGEQLGLNGSQLKALERGALLHDIGKIGISDTILHKPGKLTDDEWRIMRIHTDIGARIVEGIPFLQETLPVIRFHHERWDGTGYPLGLRGHDIPIQARIFAVADVFDALTSSRSYRKRSSADEAVRYLLEKSGTLFDPAIVHALTQLPYANFIQGEKTTV